jgi:hypothetical protein
MRLGITRKSDLALRALRHLARLDQPLRRNEFADAIDTTPAFLAQVMSPLVKAGCLLPRAQRRLPPRCGSPQDLSARRHRSR